MQKPATTAIFTLIVLIGLGSGCRSMTGRSLGTNIDDKLTNAQVKARLSATEVRNLTWVDVDTKSGVVYLSGNVRADADRQQAEDLARRSAGVRQVVNNLQVVGATAAVTEPGRPATTR
jgi:hyperosmotically inducible protein